MSIFPDASFPLTRLRRCRTHAWLRDMLQETTLSPRNLILPMFVQEGEDTATAIPTLPGVERLTIDLLVEKARTAHGLGIPAIALFPVIDAKLKDEQGSEALNPDNLVCRAIRALKEEAPGIGIITDVALDPFTSHGQDGIVIDNRIDNDETLKMLAKQAAVQAEAGCDILAPSDMMDGRVKIIRDALEQNSLKDTAILAYSAKYASSLYGPFRDAVDSARHLGAADKRTYQMNPGNTNEALREIALDISEGADMVMVKPALPYLDIIYRAATTFHVPVIAYQVSGEYAMIEAAAEKGMLSADNALMESLLSIRRAGAQAILTYGALRVAHMLQEKTNW